MARTLTYTGSIDLACPRAVDVNIEDIAHHLSIESRFGGASRVHYPVAQHCVLASYLVPPEDAFPTLMHDSPEYVVKDLPRPLKGLVRRCYAPIEAAVWAAICAQFGLEPELPDATIEADELMLATELRDLLRASEERDELIAGLPEPMVGTIDPIAPKAAEEAFLARFYQLRGEHRAHAWNVLG